MCVIKFDVPQQVLTVSLLLLHTAVDLSTSLSLYSDLGNCQKDKVFVDRQIICHFTNFDICVMQNGRSLCVNLVYGVSMYDLSIRSI